MLFILFVFLFKFCSGLEPIDCDSESTKRLHCDLIDLGITIKDRLLDPKTDQEESVMVKLYQYYNMLLEIFEYLKNKDPLERSKGTEAYNQLIKANGTPPFIGLEIDYDHIRKYHNWREEIEMINIKTYVKDIGKMWGKLCRKMRGEVVEDEQYYDASSNSERLL